MKINRRKKLFTNIIKKAKLDKIAEKIITDVNSAEVKSSEEYSDKIFDALLDTIINDLI